MFPELELGFSLEPGRAPEAGGRDPDTCPGPAGLPVFVSGAPPSDFFRPTPESLLLTLFNIIVGDLAARRRATLDPRPDPTSRSPDRHRRGCLYFLPFQQKRVGCFAGQHKHGGQEERDLDPVIRIQSPVVLLNCDYASRLRSTRAQAAHQCPTSGLVLKM